MFLLAFRSTQIIYKNRKKWKSPLYAGNFLAWSTLYSVHFIEVFLWKFIISVFVRLSKVSALEYVRFNQVLLYIFMLWQQFMLCLSAQTIRASMPSLLVRRPSNQAAYSSTTSMPPTLTRHTCLNAIHTSMPLTPVRFPYHPHLQ